MKTVPAGTPSTVMSKNTMGRRSISAGFGAKILGLGFESNADGRISLARIGIGISVGVGCTTGASKWWIGWKLSIWLGTRVVKKMLEPGDRTNGGLGEGKFTMPDGGRVGPKLCTSIGTVSGVRMTGVTVECTIGIFGAGTLNGGEPGDGSGSRWMTTGSGAKVSDREGE